jgi:hypothetical protein
MGDNVLYDDAPPGGRHRRRRRRRGRRPGPPPTRLARRLTGSRLQVLPRSSGIIPTNRDLSADTVRPTPVDIKKTFERAGIGHGVLEVESVRMHPSVGGPWARVLVAVSAFLLLSMGGAIVAAPLTLPLLYLAVRGNRIGASLRTAAVVIAALTVAEVAWAATYLTLAEAQPWIWLLPIAGSAATATAFARRTPGHLATA